MNNIARELFENNIHGSSFIQHCAYAHGNYYLVPCYHDTFFHFHDEYFNLINIMLQVLAQPYYIKDYT